MPTACFQTPGLRVGLRHERLLVQFPEDPSGEQPPPREILLSDVEQVIAADSVSFSLAALGELMRRGIPFLLTGAGERVLGTCLPPGRRGATRMAQHDRARDPAFALALATNWVEAKILNSRRVLQRLAANRKHVEITPDILALTELAAKCPAARSIDSLRGYEGTAAGRYFECYGSFFPDECPFQHRSRRPPHNAPNALLSYAYTLLAAEAECALHAAGLDPSIGFYHETDDGRASLALDLIEPFRAPLADAMALDLLSHGTLHPSAHFENRDGGVFMNVEGKKRFFVAYERRMERPFTSEQTERRTTLRDQIHQQALALRQAITENRPFEPFLMN